MKHQVFMSGGFLRIQVRKFVMSLTCCWSKERCDDIAFHKICKDPTHFLLVIGKDMMKLPSTKYECHSHPVDHRKRCNETASHKICNATHKLMVIGKDVIRLLPFTKCAM